MARVAERRAALGREPDSYSSPIAVGFVHGFDGREAAARSGCQVMRKLVRTWWALRAEGRGLSLWAVARGWS